MRSSSHRVGSLAVLWLLAACKDPAVKGVELPSGVPDYSDPAYLTINRDVDVLFVIDNSASMAEEQNILASDFAAFVEVLERVDVAANYRIGITTTDDGNPWCDGTTPEEGTLQLSSCRSRLEDFTLPGASTDPPLEVCVDTCPEEWAEIATLPSTIYGVEGSAPRPWLERREGRTNLPPGLSMTQAFQCVGPQGISGCGFESPLEAMWKATRRSQLQGDPDFGFLRDDSILSIVHVTDEEDCSYNDDFETIFFPDGNRVFWSDPTADAPTSAACWNAGVTCEGSGPYDCRTVDRDVDGNEVAAADAEELAVMRPMSRYVDRLQELESHKQLVIPGREVLVSIIAGVGPDGEAIYRDGDDPQFQQDFGIGPGCGSENGQAVPPVRLRELAEAFALDEQQSMFSICDGDYAPALAAIAEAIAAQIQPACVPACVADTDPSTEVLDPSCTLVQDSPTGDGRFEQIEVPACEDDGSVPDEADACYVALVGDARNDFCADAGFNLELRIVRREGVPVPEGSAIAVDCELSDDKQADCPELP